MGKEIALSIIQSIFVVLAGALLTLFFCHMVRTGKLHEKYSLVWLLVCVGIVATPLIYPLMVGLASFWDIAEPTSFFFFGAIILLILLDLQFSFELSVARRDRRQLVIQNALLAERLERAEEIIDKLNKTSDAPSEAILNNDTNK